MVFVNVTPFFVPLCTVHNKDSARKGENIMRKKIFAIVLALCMLLTMMPSMGFAETTTSPEQLYVAWLAEGDAPSDDGKITQAKLQQNGAGCGDAMYIPIGRSVIIGFQKTQIYQRFAGSRQEVFILKIQNDENNAAQQDNGRRFHI